MSGEKPSFWTTLPGIMTGVASLITALVALMTFVNASKDGGSSPKDSPAIVNIDHCKSFAGKWNWFIGGELVAKKDGTVDWRKNPSDPVPVIAGNWVCLEKNPPTVGIRWPNGISDTLVLSPDKRSISGSNSINVQVSGTKK